MRRISEQTVGCRADTLNRFLRGIGLTRILGGILFFTLLHNPAQAVQSVTLAWDKSPDLGVVGYNLYYGVASGNYTNKVDAGNATNRAISGLVESRVYYFAATTYAAAGLESVFSNETSYTVPLSNNLPAITLTLPINGASFTALATCNLAASVTANGHTITKVQFYNGTILLGEDASAPYSFTWSNVSAGNYSLTARAVYGAGSMVDSIPANVTAVNASGTLHYDFTYASRASLLAGGWDFMARTTTGATRNTEQTSGMVVDYDQGAHPGVLRIPTDAGDLWMEANNSRNSLFRDLPANWTSVRLKLSFAPTQNFQEASIVVYQDDDNFLQVAREFSNGNKVSFVRENGGLPTTLSADVSATANLHLRLDRAAATGQFSAFFSLDGTSWLALGSATQTLNNPRVGIYTGASPGGYPNADLAWLEIVAPQTATPALAVSVASLNFPAVGGANPTNQWFGITNSGGGVLSWAAVANASAPAWLTVSPTNGVGNGTVNVSVNSASLAAGAYSKSITVTALGATNSPQTVTVTLTIPNPPPGIVLTAPTGGSSYSAPAAINLAASVTANGNPITKVQFYSGPTLLGEDAASPYNFAWNNVASGSYNLSARVVYGAGSTVTSSLANVTVTSSAPTIVLTSPSAGGSYAAPATISLAASVTANGQSITKVQFYHSTTLLGEDAAAPYSVAWSNVSSGNYSLTARVFYGAGSTVNSAAVNINVTGLPAPWQSADIGSVGMIGSGSVSNGVYTVKGAGNVSARADNFRFVYQSLAGDGEIKVRLNSVSDTGTSARIGVMIRESLTSSSKYAFMGIPSDGTFRWQRRSNTGGTTSATTSTIGTPPNAWVKLVRTGNTLYGYRSTDGTTWTQVSSRSITMATNIYVGLAVASGSSSTLNTATFSNPTVVP